ncbi:interleukin-12 receptor subunit beta-1 isoform X2 [Syngnathus typhle]|uniref:interleukin-12 receptor subunit beta-1 isoform X2 n=1 Tax=Syngnathus typhle TaxID=161592 RepID=UPI002A6A5011|nr:interleukin-12 receptor subunit beta-1 isoform X2 [Syngnathus typhle]
MEHLSLFSYTHTCKVLSLKLMETLGWTSLLRCISMFLVFTSSSAKGSECESLSSPQCFRRNSETTFYVCEWRMNTTRRDVTFELHFDRTDNDISFENIRETHAEIVAENLITSRRVEFWVEAHAGGSVCKSNETSGILKQIVKFEAPEDISVTWFQNHLNVTWKAAENYPALAERVKTTEFRSSKMAYQLSLENLQKHTSYQVKLRHRTNVTATPLWSEWSPLLIVPAELEDKLEVNVTLKRLEGARKVTLMWKPVDHAAAIPSVSYILRDTQTSEGCPCEKEEEIHPTDKTEYTDYVSYSPVNFSVMAKNAAGSSPVTVVHIPAEPAPHLKPCNKKLADAKRNETNHCLEWYRLQDGDLKLVARKTKRDKRLFRKSIKDYVGYIYFEHLCIDEKPKTVQMCLYYKKENVPKIAPQDLLAFNETHNSVTLTWKAIPEDDARGFLTRYNVCSVKINLQKEHIECHTVAASLSEYSLENLTPGTKYNFTVAGVTKAGEGPKATVTLKTQHLNLMKGWLILALVMAFLFIFLLMVCSCIWKKMKKKILVPLPKPPILELSAHQGKSVHQDMLEENEEVVNEVTLHKLLPKEEEDLEETTMSLNRDDTQQALRSSKEEEMTNTEQEDVLALLRYRKGLIFEMKTDEC